MPLLAVALLAAIVLLSRGGGSTGNAPATFANPVGTGGFDGAELPGSLRAPDFTLTDQRGRSVSLSQYRGQVTVLTFLSSTCGATCVLIAQQIRGALDELTRPAPVLIVSADPTADSPAHVSGFLREVSLSGRVEYLTGPERRLRSIWSAYGVTPASAGRRAFDSRAKVLLLDRAGVERVVYESEQLTPESLTHDIGKLRSG
jgi:protein SCO1